jgi:hypothetical protein
MMIKTTTPEKNAAPTVMVKTSPLKQTTRH